MVLRTLAVTALTALLWSPAALAQDEAPAAEETTTEDGSVAVETVEEVSEEEAMETGKFNRRLRTVEEDVNRLKERVFRSKATLQLLKELVIEGISTGSRVALWHVNKMGAAYSMESVQYFLDGKNVFGKVDPSGSLDDTREFKVHEQSVPPGSHTVQVNMVLRGHGFGVFSYLKTYSFKVQSSYGFEVEDGKLTTVKIIANERAGIGRSFVDRPSVQYEAKAISLREQ